MLGDLSKRRAEIKTITIRGENKVNIFSIQDSVDFEFFISFSHSFNLIDNTCYSTTC